MPRTHSRTTQRFNSGALVSFAAGSIVPCIYHRSLALACSQGFFIPRRNWQDRSRSIHADARCARPVPPVHYCILPSISFLSGSSPLCASGESAWPIPYFLSCIPELQISQRLTMRCSQRARMSRPLLPPPPFRPPRSGRAMRARG